MKMKITEAMNTLTTALKSDDGYYMSWQANIAMAFVDAVSRVDITDKKELHEVANVAAKDFLENLCRNTK